MSNLKQSKCPNCGAQLDTRRFVPDGYEVDRDGNRYPVCVERKYIKCKMCRSEFELSEEEKAVAEKAAKLIARDYGETLKKLADS